MTGKKYDVENLGHTVKMLRINRKISQILLAEKLGMRREGIFYKECYFKRDATGEPIWIDSLQYALLREEWEAQHEAAKMEDHFYQSV